MFKTVQRGVRVVCWRMLKLVSTFKVLQKVFWSMRQGTLQFTLPKIAKRMRPPMHRALWGNLSISVLGLQPWPWDFWNPFRLWIGGRLTLYWVRMRSHLRGPRPRPLDELGTDLRWWLHSRKVQRMPQMQAFHHEVPQVHDTGQLDPEWHQCHQAQSPWERGSISETAGRCAQRYWRPDIKDE